MTDPRPRAQVIALPARGRPRPAPSPLPPSPAEEAAAQESAERAARRRALWLRETQFVATSYTLNALCLALFAFTGTVHWAATLAYVLPGWACSGVAAWLIATDRTRDFPEPSLSTLQSGVALLVCGAGIAVFPEMTFLYALIMFTVFLSATYRTPKVQITTAWALASIVIAASTLLGGRGLQIPHANAMEQLASLLCFTLTLARCVLLSVINSGHNQLLRDRGLQMAETLAEIERLASHDELTGLLNRRSMLRVLSEEMDRARRGELPLSIALLDIDHFKSVNDRLGHLVGDRALRGFASAVESRRRATDRFGRYGGEEFLMVLPDTDPEEGMRALDRLREGLAAHDWAAVSPGLSVRFSAGLATWTPGEPIESLLSRADRGLYGAKHAGRNCHRTG